MNILFLTLLDFSSIEERGIYTDLMREFVKNGHNIYIISPVEKRKKQETKLISHNEYKILKLKIGNTQKTNSIEKGISTITLDKEFLNAVKTYFSDTKFDLVIYSTPPITLGKTITFVKKRDNSKTYLLLKDIFPQNAVDIGILKKEGLKSILYNYFRKKEKDLYKISDYIGCMSQANVDYLIKNNPEIPREIVEVCPNSIEPILIEKDGKIIQEIKTKYRIPNEKVIFLYGGNLGKPQGVDFLIKVLSANKNNQKVYFLIIGSGTEFSKIKSFIEKEKPLNAQLLFELPKQDYEILANACDVGLIFLDYRFTIPNFPSRLLSYMQASIPVLAATDLNTDLRKVIENGECGLWCKSNEIEGYKHRIEQLCDAKLRESMGRKARRYLEDHYTVKHSYEIIMKHFM